MLTMPTAIFVSQHADWKQKQKLPQNISNGSAKVAGCHVWGFAHFLCSRLPVTCLYSFYNKKINGMCSLNKSFANTEK